MNTPVYIFDLSIAKRFEKINPLKVEYKSSIFMISRDIYRLLNQGRKCAQIIFENMFEFFLVKGYVK